MKQKSNVKKILDNPRVVERPSYASTYNGDSITGIIKKPKIESSPYIKNPDLPSPNNKIEFTIPVNNKNTYKDLESSKWSRYGETSFEYKGWKITFFKENDIWNFFATNIGKVLYGWDAKRLVIEALTEGFFQINGFDKDTISLIEEAVYGKDKRINHSK